MSAPIDLARHWTIDDLDQLPDDGNRYEIVDGNLVVSPPPDVPVSWRLECDPELVLHPFVLVDGAYAPRPPITAQGTAPAPWGDVEVDLTELP